MSHNILSASSIDFLKSCSTGVNLVPGFANVHYWLYTAEPLPSTPKLANAKNVEDALFEVEVSLRDQRELVFCDAERQSIWLFKGAPDSTALQQPDLDKMGIGIENYGWTLKIVFSGSLKASELSIFSSKLAPLQTPSTLSTQALLQMSMANMSAAANARTLQQQSSGTVGAAANGTAAPMYDRNNLRFFYSLFVRTVQAHFGYMLSQEGRALQLDSRTFVQLRQEQSTTALEEEPLPLNVFTIDPFLANGGGMLVSTGIISDVELYPLSMLDRAAAEGLEVVVAPGGLTATVLADPTNLEESHVNQWKGLVLTQLHRRGVHVAQLDRQDRWLLLRTQNLHLLPEPGENTTFYWPLALCFSKAAGSVPLEKVGSRESLTIAQDLEDRNGLYWFETADKDGYKEPLHVAEDWFSNKASRDKIVEERRRRTEMLKKQHETASAASPAHTRDGLQVISGVYPTPPDGVLLQTSNAPTTHDGQSLSLPVDQSAHRSSLDMQHSDMMDLDVGTFDDNVRQRPSLVSRASLDAAVKMDGEDFFGDMEDEDLQGQDITDADFSFFDEPESSEAMMLDGTDEGPKVLIKPEGPDILHAPEDERQDSQVHVQGSPMNDAPKYSISTEAVRTDMPTGSVEDAEAIKDTPVPDRPTSVDNNHLAQETLDPASVQKQLFESGITSDLAGLRSSHFEPISFNSSIRRKDAKYNSNGTFAFKVHTPWVTREVSATSTRMKPRPPDEVSSKSATAPQICKNSSKHTATQDSESSIESSDSSDEDIGYYHGHRSLVTSPTKARFQDDTGSTIDETQSIPGSGLSNNQSLSLDSMQQNELLSLLLESTTTLPRTLLPSLQIQSTEISLSADSARTQLVLPPIVHADSVLNPVHKDFINVAQIVAEQVSNGFVNDIAHVSAVRFSPTHGKQPAVAASPAKLRSVIGDITASYPGLVQCDLLSWLCLQEAVPDKANFPKGHVPINPKKITIPGLQTADGAPVPTSALSPLHPPHVRVRRNEGLWDVLPPALPFWEQLGLAPAGGRKNVMAFCIYPGNDDLKRQISIFMDYLGATFESCKLGAHVRATQLAGIDNGMVPIELTAEHSMSSVVDAIQDVCVDLGRTLAGIDWQNKFEFTPATEELNKIDNFIIYMINPFEQSTRGMMELCASFWALYETYRQAVSSPTLRAQQPDIVLQILPVHFVADPHTPVTMDTSFYQKLAREVYDRCPPASSDRSTSRLPIEYAPAVQLEQSLPRKIDFKLQSDPPPDLLHEGSNLHLGYTKSTNGEWISVAWTDGTGKYQASANYCLVGGRTFAEVARVIWQSTLEIMQARRVAWRLCIARVGSIEKDELDIWSMLATSASSVMMITVIMSFDPEPPFMVFYESSSLTSKAGGQTSSQTPVGTPRSGVSPDTVLTPAATPNTEGGPDFSNDPDAHLVDIGDETWGLILGHRTNVADSITEYRPSLSTGFLMKTSTPTTSPLDDPEEASLKGLILIGVKLVWIGSSPKPVPQSQAGQQPSPLSTQSPFSATSSSPTDMNAGVGIAAPSTASSTPSAQGQQQGQLNTSTSGSTIPKVTADSILRDYLQMYRNLGVLARARGLRGTKRGTLPWHIVVVLRAVEGLEASYGTIQAVL